MQPTLHELARQAMEVFHRNTDTLVAGFLIRNPDINPADIELVMHHTSDGMRLSVHAKELHIPPAKPDPAHEEGSTEVFTHAQREAYVDGWNDCRQAMIDEAAKHRTSADVTPLVGGAHD